MIKISITLFGLACMLAGCVSHKPRMAPQSIITPSPIRNELSTTEFYNLILSENAVTNLTPTEKQEKLIEYFGYAPDIVVSFAASYYYKNKEYEKALECETRAIKLNPDKADYCFRATIHIAMKQDRLAEEDFKKALSIDPNYTTVYIERGRYLFERNRYGEAEWDYRKLTELDPNDPTSRYWYGRVLHHLGKYKEAVQEYSSCVASKSAPKHLLALAYMGRGQTYDAWGHPQDALASFDSAMEIAPNEIVLYLLKADLLRREEQFDNASTVCNKALSLDPDNEHVMKLADHIKQEQSQGDKYK